MLYYDNCICSRSEQDLKMWSNCCNSESPGKRACLLTNSAALKGYEHQNGEKFQSQVWKAQYSICLAINSKMMRTMWIVGHFLISCTRKCIVVTICLVQYFYSILEHMMHFKFSAKVKMRGIWQQDWKCKQAYQRCIQLLDSNRPHVNTSWVMGCSKQNFRGSIPECHNLQK